MSRHELDVTSLVAGLVFLVGGATLLVSRTTDVHASWVLTAALLAFGVAAVVGGAVRMSRGPEPSGTGVTDPATEPDPRSGTG